MRIRLLHGYPPLFFDQQECGSFEREPVTDLPKRRGNGLVDELDGVDWPRAFAR